MPNSFLCTTCGFRQDPENEYVEHGIRDCLAGLASERAELRAVAELVDYTERSRGYPMPGEWEQVVRAARGALKR